MVGSATRNLIGRFHANGSLDTSFNPGATGTGGYEVRALVVQSDAKILVGGYFYGLGGGTGTTVRNFLGRLNADGSVDMSFNPGANSFVNAFAVQADGKILIAGSFTTLGGGGYGTTTRNYIGRLMVDPPSPPTVTTHPSNRTVTAGATVSFSAAASGVPAPTLQWQVSTNSGTTFTNISGATAGTYSFVAATNDDGKRFRAVFTNAYGSATSSNASLTVVPQLTLAEALDTTNLTWTTGGSAGWIAQTITTYDGIDAARSGLITDSQESWMQTTVTNGPGTLNFWWKVSSESGFDYLQFYANGVLQSGRISGEVDWQQQAWYLPAGTWTLKWSYLKDSSASSGQDKAWVDRVWFVPDVPMPPTITAQPASLTVSVGQNASFTVTAAGTATLSYQWRKGGVDLTGATNAFLTLSNVQTNQAGIYAVAITNAYGSVTSSNAALTVLPTISLAEALDTTNLTWTTGGSAGWSGQSGNTHDGVDAAQSGLITDSQEAWMETTVTNGPSTLTFWWKVSSEATYDYLEFYINGVLQSGRISGEVNWQQQTFDLAGGSNVLRWRYFKDGGVSTGQDRGWVDQVLFVPVAPPMVVAWGYNGDGQTTVPTGLSGVKAIAAGGTHTVALKSNGTVVAWGGQYNNYGQTTVPAGLSGVAAIAAGMYHTVALKSDGTVLAWGDNTYGQTTVPAGLSGVTAVAAYMYHTLALKSSGTVVGWGDNSDGQTTVPAGLSGVAAIAAGGYHAVALKSNGTVAAWGVQNFYNVGQTTVPAGLSGVAAIAAGGYHTVALKSDGTVLAWGDNSYGQTTVPAGLSGVNAIAAGWFHTVALKSNGMVLAWGGNSNGQTAVPVGLTGVTAIAAGVYQTVALLGTGFVGPTVTSRISGSNLTLLWADSATGYRVESALSLSPPTSWSNVPGTLQTNGGFISMVLPTSGQRQFYRLVKP